MSRHRIDHQTVKQSALSLLNQGIAPSIQKLENYWALAATPPLLSI